MTVRPPTTVTQWKRARITLGEVDRYLSRRCAEGWVPVSVTFGNMFSFARTEPGEYVCATASTVTTSGLTAGRLDREKYSELAALLEAQGAVVVPQGLVRGDQEGIIAVRRADQGPLEIHSDTGSAIDDLVARRRHYVVRASSYLAAAAAWLAVAAVLGWPTIVSIMWLLFAAEYGWDAVRCSAAVNRLRPDREVFE